MALHRLLARALGAAVLGTVLAAAAQPDGASPAPSPGEVPETPSSGDRRGDPTTGAGAEGTYWYRLEINGDPAGWALERIGRHGRRVTTASRLELRLRRGTTEVRIELSSRFIETADGRPVEYWQRQTLGRLPVETTYRFPAPGEPGDARAVEVTTVQAGRETHSRLPPPEGPWSTPEAARRALLDARREGVDRYTVRLLEPDRGLEVVTAERRLLGPATRPGAVDRWRERRLGGDSGSDEARAAVLELDAHGREVWTVRRFAGLELRSVRTDRESALAAAPPGSAPELMVSAFVAPDRPIPSPRRLRRAVYELSLAPAPTDPGGADTATDRLQEIPETEAQRLLPAASRSTVRLEVEVRPSSPRSDDGAGVGAGVGDRPAPVDADGAPPPFDRAAHLAASPFLDHRDPAVRSLLEAADLDRSDRPPDADPVPADAPEPTLRQRADRLTTTVRSLVTDKGLDTGFATASEVARTRTGDCTEHAVLLAALLRADGIPSRVASGLVYLEEFAGRRNVFVYHMWTQALIDGRWVDLDAATPGDIDGFDATHVALAVSALSGNGAAADLAPLAELMGRLRIRVLETVH